MGEATEPDSAIAGEVYMNGSVFVFAGQTGLETLVPFFATMADFINMELPESPRISSE